MDPEEESAMKNQRLLVVLTVLNAVVMLFLLARPSAGVPDTVPVLRGRALEIVDEHGKVRASITVIPADPTVKMPDGTRGVPETVLLRLIDPHGRPNVKIGASETGSGLGLGGKSDPTYVQVLAQRGTTSLKLTNQDGREQVIKP
jgi:hypothetical protein